MHLNYITIKDEKYYFRNKLTGKGYEFCKTPFNELSNTDESLLKSDLNKNNSTHLLQAKSQKALENLSIEAKTKVDLKLKVMRAWETNKTLNPKVRLREAAFIENFKRENEKDILFIGGKFSCTKKNIRDYKKAYEKDGLEGLIDKRGRVKGDNYKVSNWALDMLKELFIYYRGSVKPRNLYDIINKEAFFKGQLSNEDYKKTLNRSIGGVVSLSRVRDIVNELKQDRQLQYLNNPDKFKNSNLPAFGDMRAKALYANHYWEIDSTKLDAFVNSNTETETTYSLISISDIKSGMKVIGIVKNSNSQGIAELLYKAFNKLGIPENIVTDNGKDYLSKHTTKMLELWGIKQIKTAPYSGEEKPFVERHFGTLQNRFTELLSGFKGHSVTQFQELNSQTATSDRLSGNRLEKNIQNVENLSILLDEWVDNIYSNSHNSTLGSTPYEAYVKDEKYIQRANIEDLVFAFGKQVEVTVGKKGIRHNKKVYNNAEGLLGNKVGDDFTMIIDLLDYNKSYLFDLEGNYICLLSTDEVSKETALAAKNYYKQDIKDYERNFKKVHKKYKDINQVEEILTAAKEVYKDQTPIEMIGGNGVNQNAGNIEHLNSIASRINSEIEKREIVTSEPDIEVHERALDRYKERKEKDKTNRPRMTYDELILSQATG